MPNEFQLDPSGSKINHHTFSTAFKALVENYRYNQRDVLFIDLDETILNVLSVMREKYGRDFPGTIGGQRYEDEAGLTADERIDIAKGFARGAFYKDQPLIDAAIPGLLQELAETYNICYLSARQNTTDVYEYTVRSIRKNKLPYCPILLNPYVNTNGPEFKIDVISRFSKVYAAPGYVPILIDDEPSQATAIVAYNTAHPSHLIYHICMVQSEIRSIQHARSHRDVSTGVASGVYGHILHQEANGIYFSKTAGLLMTIDRIKQDSRIRSQHRRVPRSFQ
ncbi:MAG: hypothetical protein WCO78_05280 [Candidatus Roizmanbacteria bacterium]